MLRGLFALRLEAEGLLPQVTRVDVRLHGSLGATGKGHGSDKAVMLGLEGDEPATVDVDAIAGRLQRIRADRSLRLLGKHAIGFDEREHLHFLTKALPFHANGLQFSAADGRGASC